MSLIITIEDRVLRLTMNRPTERNGLNAQLCSELMAAFQKAEADPAIGAILLDAKGEFFCAGLDRNEEASHLFTAGSRLRKPLVAAIQGHAFSGGLGLIANAHVAVAAQGCSFGLTDIRAGIWPYAPFHAVSLAIGTRRAVELSLTGRVFSTPEALQWGLIHYQTPAFELEDRAMQLAIGLADASPLAIHAGLDFAQRLKGMNDRQAGDLATGLQSEAATSPDFLEGMQALQERRRPVWPSRTM